MNKIKFVNTIEEYNNLVDCEFQSLPRVISITRDIADYIKNNLVEDNCLSIIEIHNSDYKLDELIDNVICDKATLIMIYNNTEELISDNLINKMYANNIIILKINN